MKLVDILARELKEWPEGMSETVGQAHSGYLHGYAGNGHPNAQTTKASYSMCDNYEFEKVNRAEWQAAVDALNAESCAHLWVGWDDTEACELCNATRKIAIEWNGEGWPPVGAQCEMSLFAENKWEVCTPVYYLNQPDDHSDQVVVYQDSLGGDVCYILDPPCAGSIQFRPIRTPEQIAAEERETELNRMVATVSMLDKGWARKVCAGLYDAGYRKFEIVEGE